ncbi:uncharacterized protein IWZ02DRAFT_178667 [Phyllosticta citriasiana]|uniref:uncharacterized protein n=1 Tax=Phyllosticta citriasiana TaxID=595635 RepID=UPI0030FD346D
MHAHAQPIPVGPWPSDPHCAAAPPRQAIFEATQRRRRRSSDEQVALTNRSASTRRNDRRRQAGRQAGRPLAFFAYASSISPTIPPLISLPRGLTACVVSSTSPLSSHSPSRTRAAHCRRHAPPIRHAARPPARSLARSCIHYLCVHPRWISTYVCALQPDWLAYPALPCPALPCPALRCSVPSGCLSVVTCYHRHMEMYGGTVRRYVAGWVGSHWRCAIDTLFCCRVSGTERN